MVMKFTTFQSIYMFSSVYFQSCLLICRADLINDIKDLKIASQREYEDILIEEMRNDKIFKYNDQGKPEESLRESIHKILRFWLYLNCTHENKNLSLKCMQEKLEDFKKRKISADEKLHYFSQSLFILIVIYVTIAILLWCWCGWCCWCCRCKICQPDKTLKEIQTYVSENPPGIYNCKGLLNHYTPTKEEIEKYEELNGTILSF